MVSVVIPAYNSAWSIADTLRSVLNQILSDIEVIIVNDGSSDALHAQVARAAQGDRRVRIVDQQNRGLAGARNRGIAEARASLVGLIDADDLWHPAFLSVLRRALLASPAAPFAFAHSIRIDADNRVIPSPRWRHPPRHDLAGLLAVNSVGNGSAALFRRQSLRAIGGFDESFKARGLQGAEDWNLCLRLAAQAEPVLVPQYLVAYRLLAGSMSQSDPERQLAAIRAVLAEAASAHPDLSSRTIAEARTMMIGWLLPAFVRKRKFARVAALLREAYAGNPLWFRSRDLRALHVMKAKSILRGMLAVLVPSLRGPLLAELREDGRHPFAFLRDGAATSRPARPLQHPTTGYER